MKIKKKIKKGDMIEVISGIDKGKQGKIITIFHRKNSVVIEKINMKTKHIKPNQSEEAGQIKYIEAPIHISNIKLIAYL